MGSETLSTAPRVGMCGGRKTSRAGNESAIALFISGEMVWFKWKEMNYYGEDGGGGGSMGVRTLLWLVRVIMTCSLAFIEFSLSCFPGKLMFACGENFGVLK